MARRYFRKGIKKIQPNATAAQLHQFRLASKAMRYTLELFTPVYGPTLAELIGSVKELQTLLGEMYDCETILQMQPDDQFARSGCAAAPKNGASGSSNVGSRAWALTGHNAVS
jgi:CHAD domain-containing protein